MATSDSPLNVPNVTLAVARGAIAENAITGTGFGSKFGSLQVSEDFESVALGSIESSSVGSNLQAAHISGLSVNSTARDGGKCLVNDFSTTDVSDFPKLHKVLSGSSRKGYMGCWVKREIYAAITGNTPVWKFSRVNCGVLYSGFPQFSHEYVGINSLSLSGQLYDESGGIGNAGTASVREDPLTRFPENTWVFYEVEYDFGTPGGTDCFFEARINGVAVFAFYGADGFAPLVSGSTDFPEFFITPINGMGEGQPIRMWIDDIYLDESRARVVMTNTAEYQNATKWAVQHISSYSDTAVSYTPKRQDFGIGETAYLHLFNDNGELVKSTSAITVEAD